MAAAEVGVEVEAERAGRRPRGETTGQVVGAGEATAAAGMTAAAMATARGAATGTGIDGPAA